MNGKKSVFSSEDSTACLTIRMSFLNSSSPAAKGNSFPTADERAQTQVYIIRQSSLTNANATLATAGKPVTQDKVEELAQVYERYVLGLESPPQAIKEPESIADLASDIPF